MKYFAQPFPVQGNAYSCLADSPRDDITIGLQSSQRVSIRTSRQLPTEESDNAYVQSIEEKHGKMAEKSAPKCGDFERAVLKRLKELAKKASQAFRKKPKDITQASKPKPKPKVSAYGQYAQPYVFW